MEAPKNILVIEDEKEIRQMLREVLEFEGYEVSTACDGQEALEYLAAFEAPHLILTDLNMPRLSGWEFLEKKALDKSIADIPTLVLSATCDQGLARANKASHCLKKPIHLEELFVAIREYARS